MDIVHFRSILLTTNIILSGIFRWMEAFKSEGNIEVQ